MHNKVWHVCLARLVFLVLLAVSAAADSLGLDFSTSSNPNGVWSYGVTQIGRAHV